MLWYILPKILIHIYPSAGACKRLGYLRRNVFSVLFSHWCLHSPSPPTQQVKAMQIELCCYLIYLMCKKPTCDASQKGSKRQNLVTFFWLVENYIHFSYPKCVGRLWWGQKLVNLEKTMGNIVFKTVTNV